MTTPFQNDRSFRRAAGAAVVLLAIYLLGYALLCSQDYFDLARLPWSPHPGDALHWIYSPLEWLRHLW